MKQHRVLVVEDDKNLGIILSEYLIAKNYETSLAEDGEQGYELFSSGEFDLCILDVMMPKKDGFTLAKEIRLTDKNIPIIFLTAKSMKEDTIEGFNVGGDDYITKPFSMEELLVRIQAILRRTAKGQGSEETVIFKIGQFSFDARKQVLNSDQSNHKLTSKENELLRLLVLNKNETLERTEALKLIWKDDSYFNSRSMDVYITKLRKYLKEDSSIEIVNVHGQGFRLQCD